MKYLKEKKKSPLGKIVLLVVLVAVLAALVLFLVLNKDNQDAPIADEPQTQQTDAAGETQAQDDSETPTAAATAPSADSLAIETPYCTLYYPGEWESFLQVDQSGDLTVKFTAKLESGKTQELFSVIFGSEENAVGAVKTADGASVPVSFETTAFTPDETWDDREINIVYTMQEAMNDLMAAMPLEQLSAEQSSQAAQATEPAQPEDPEDQEAMVIDTPYCELHYPVRWLDYLDLEIQEEDPYSVVFYGSIGGHDRLHLFTVHFGGDQGTVVGTAKDTDGKSVEVRLTVVELDMDDTWTSEEKSTAYSMQEDLNYLLTKLG